MTNYISAGCNPVPQAADWGQNGLICYGACNAIAIYDPNVSKVGKVLETLHRHTKRVNIVRWIKRVADDRTFPEEEFLSGSVDGTTIIWTKTETSFDSTSILETGDVITISDAQYVNNYEDKPFDTLLVCTGSHSGIKLWLRTNGEVECFQTLTFGTKLPIVARLSFLPNSKLVLIAVAIEDSSIFLYSQTSEYAKEFVKVQTLVGHQDWVRSMDFTYHANGEILLASTQDSMINLWKISVDQEEPVEELKQKKQMFTLNDCKYVISLESVLNGHEGWVYGVHWHPVVQNNGRLHQPMKLLTCSIDKSMIIWAPDEATGIWLETTRVGEVGGNSLGFYGCQFSADGLCIFAHGFQGSFHMWLYSSTVQSWVPTPIPSGHFKEVVDICWDPKGRFLISASADQTTRIHAPWKVGIDENWHEIGRPQVHGYDMSCLAMLKPYMFASGAEEKVVRIFTASAAFTSQLSKIASTDDFLYTAAETASVPALGLTNKASFDTKLIAAKNIKVHSENEDYVPPTEEELMQNTLWPELQKLYGHGYEIFSMAARHDGSLLATACKATTPEHAAIILWDLNTWSSVQKLMSHQLTVTQIAFSPDDEYLVSVSRDRRWSLFRQVGNSYELVVASSKKNAFHSRIIWCCAWTSDSQYFATGSREGKVGVWEKNVNPENILPVTHLDTGNNSVTALCFAPLIKNGEHYFLAIGYESGCIEIQKITKTSNSLTWKKCLFYNTLEAHHLTVKRLQFQPTGFENNILRLASCGSDHFVKIHDIDVSEF